ncbi:hypothetical protein GC163_20465 [bacterium]|nr:hypothetical protein [bacterium]
MLDDTPHQDRLQRDSPPRGLKGILESREPPREKEKDVEGAEAACRAFGYLRGIRDQSAAVEFRFRDGNSVWFPYSWLGTWKFNPSEGLLLKFSGDLVYLVLIKGSNLDKPLKEGSVTLTHAGFQRHRLLWVREMTEEEIRQVGETEPTIDSIEVAEFESHAALKEWLSKKAPAFVR